MGQRTCLCLYYVNDNDNDNDGARFYSKSNANNSIVNYAVLLFIWTLKGEWLHKTDLQEFQVTDRAGMLDDAFNLARYI